MEKTRERERKKERKRKREKEKKKKKERERERERERNDERNILNYHCLSDLMRLLIFIILMALLSYYKKANRMGKKFKE